MINLDDVSFAHDEPPTLIRRRPTTLEKRFTVRLPIELDVRVEGAGLCFQATTGDVSRGGMFIVTHCEAPVGAELILTFTLPNGTAIQVLGVVQWTTPDTDGLGDVLSPRVQGLGLAFFCPRPEVIAELDRFCSAREPLYYAV